MRRRRGRQRLAGNDGAGPGDYRTGDKHHGSLERHENHGRLWSHDDNDAIGGHDNNLAVEFVDQHDRTHGSDNHDTHLKGGHAAYYRREVPGPFGGAPSAFKASQRRVVVHPMSHSFIPPPDSDADAVCRRLQDEPAEGARDRPVNDPDAPGIDVDDTTSDSTVNEPNEPA